MYPIYRGKCGINAPCLYVRERLNRVELSRLDNSYVYNQAFSLQFQIGWCFLYTGVFQRWQCIWIFFVFIIILTISSGSTTGSANLFFIIGRINLLYKLSYSGAINSGENTIAIKEKPSFSVILTDECSVCEFIKIPSDELR